MPPKFLTGESWLRLEGRLPGGGGRPHARFEVGDAVVHVLPEISARADPAGIFGSQGLLGDGEEARIARGEHLGEDGCLAGDMMFAALLVQVDGVNILLDTCLGEVNVPDYVPAGADGVRRTTWPLLESLEKYAEVRPEEIDFVIHSHHHADHIGWNVRYPRPGGQPGEEPVASFPKAKHVFQRAEWEYPAKHFACPWRGEWEVKCRPLERAGMVRLVDGDAKLLPGVSLVAAPGHTPGHQCVRIESQGRVAYYVGDALHTVPQVTWPEFGPVFDCCRWDPARALKLERPPLEEDASARHRASLLQRIHAESAVLLSPHLPFPGAGTLSRRGDDGSGRFLWRPLAAGSAAAPGRSHGGLWARLAWCCGGV